MTTELYKSDPREYLNQLASGQISQDPNMFSEIITPLGKTRTHLCTQGAVTDVASEIRRESGSLMCAGIEGVMEEWGSSEPIVREALITLIRYRPERWEGYSEVQRESESQAQIALLLRNEPKLKEMFLGRS